MLEGVGLDSPVVVVECRCMCSAAVVVAKVLDRG